MTSLDAQIEAVTAILRAQGTVVGIDPAAPDYVKQAWLNMILECPQCWGKGEKDREKGN